jgi:uncharacterized protein (DUF1697 family)
MKKASASDDFRAYVAFLRGINVGGNAIIRMEDLKKAFESPGFRDVRTVLASGNVAFWAPEKDTAALEAGVAKMLGEKFGRDISVVVRTLDGLRELDARRPFRDVEGMPGVKLYVTFLPGNAKPTGGAGLPSGDGYRVLGVEDGVICSVLDGRPGIGTPELMKAIEKTFGKNVTTRTWNTVIRLLK